MKTYINFKVIGLLLIIFGAFGCDDTELTPVAGTESYPAVTFSVNTDATEVEENDTIIYTITLDRPIDSDLEFSARILDGDADDSDIEVIPALVAAYDTTAQLQIIFSDDHKIESPESIKIEVGIFDIGTKYLVKPTTVNPIIEKTINEDSEYCALSLGWTTDDDIDFFIYKEDDAWPYAEHSAEGATGANPEYDSSVKMSEPGTYYVNFMTWGADAFDYTFTFRTPDGTISTLDGHFQSDNLKAYYNDPWFSWGKQYSTYRVLKVVNDGTNFTFTKLDDLTSADYVANMKGTWGGEDGSTPYFMYAVDNIEITEDAGNTMIYGINKAFMEDLWEETVDSGNPVEMLVYANGNVVIPRTYYWTTIYDGDPYDYKIYGIGSYSDTDGLHLEYEMDQDGFLVAEFLYSLGYSDVEFFTANLTKNAKKASVSKVDKSKINFVKPQNRVSQVTDRTKQN